MRAGLVPAELHQGGDHVRVGLGTAVAHRLHPLRALRSSLRGPQIVPGDRAQLVGHVQDDALSALGSQAGYPREGGDVLGGDGPPERVGRVDGQHRQRQLGSNTLGAHQGAKAVPLVGVGEAEQGQRVLTDHHLGVHEGLLADPEAGQRGGRGLDTHADAAGLNDGAGQADTEDSAAQGGDHGRLLLGFSADRALSGRLDGHRRGSNRRSDPSSPTSAGSSAPHPSRVDGAGAPGRGLGGGPLALCRRTG